MKIFQDDSESRIGWPPAGSGFAYKCAWVVWWICLLMGISSLIYLLIRHAPIS